MTVSLRPPKRPFNARIARGTRRVFSSLLVHLHTQMFAKNLGFRGLWVLLDVIN